jgi:hypothetical protein
MPPRFNQDVLEIMFEYAGNFDELLRLRQVSEVWRDAARAVADFHRRTGHVLTCRSWPDEPSPTFPRWDLDPVHPRLVCVNAGMPASRILRAAVVLIPATLDQLSVSHTRQWTEFVNFANRLSRPAEPLTNLTRLELADGGDDDADSAVSSLTGLQSACPRLTTLTFEASTNLPATFFAHVVCTLHSLTELSVRCDDLSVSPSTVVTVASVLGELPLLQRVQLTALRKMRSAPFAFTLSPGGWPCLQELKLCGGFVVNSYGPQLSFPPSLRELTVDALPPGTPHLPPTLTALTVRGALPASCLPQVPKLRRLQCERVVMPPDGDVAAVAQVLGGLEEFSWMAEANQDNCVTFVLAHLGAPLRSLSLAVNPRLVIDTSLPCPSLTRLTLQPGAILGDLGTAFSGNLTSLVVFGAPRVEDLRWFNRLSDVEANVVEAENWRGTWTDAHIEAIPSEAPLTTLRVNGQSGITRVSSQSEWRHTLADLDVSSTSFAVWQSLLGFTALRTLKAVNVAATWESLPSAFAALGGLEELCIGNYAVMPRDYAVPEPDTMPPDMLRQLALVTRHIRRLYFCGPDMKNNIVFYDCIRDHWRCLERVCVSNGNDKRMLEVLKPPGAWIKVIQPDRIGAARTVFVRVGSRY